MSGDLLDVLLVLLALIFGVSGYRQGFIVGALSFVGFLGGGVLGAIFAPRITERLVEDQGARALLAILFVFVAAAAGQFLSSSIGAAVRNHVTWHPARFVDALGGSAVSIVAMLLIAWFVGTAVAHSPFPALSYQVRHSQVLRSVDQLMPDVARTWFSTFRRIVDRNTFPQVFGTLGPERIVDVPPPDAGVLTSEELRRARRSVVKIVGTAPACQRRIEGTGFVYAPGRVMTNAHVVAGVRGGPRVISAGGRDVDEARVVVYDPQRDVAVLHVPGLDVRPLKFNGRGDSGDNAVVAGYPRGRDFTAVPARIRGTQLARGPDIYHSQQVTREIYALRARVEPGNSGGPLLAHNGTVYGVVFAAAVDDPDTGYALTAQEVSSDARRGRTATQAVSTQLCD
ncbi:MAG: MarP family serine protease [Streptosporangiales bacterium]|nr:MarP family serine protease [Streptosporangiales bacterium]